MGTGIWANFHWESGIWVTGNGNHRQKNNKTGTGIFKIWKKIGWEMGFGQNFGWENGIYTPPPSGPS